MQPLILASRSPARKKLLAQLGLKFQVIVSDSVERSRGYRSYRQLVIKNAQSKAMSVAGRLDRGIIIAADTVVVVSKKIIGKPKTFAAAVRTLKKLSRNPHWVYTGIAVLDVWRNRCFTGYEKTKIYMYPLTDTQIKRYFEKVSPFDKAGGFAIQGLGAVFIDRIEGCYYNVVGLPLAHLAKLLSKVGREIF
ncbi:MAG: septum formation protein Maf [Candidatus Omnitrophica bacterium]|nr:septum formation protein Maf [Candidatus Omnitrophota bacterium]